MKILLWALAYAGSAFAIAAVIMVRTIWDRDKSVLSSSLWLSPTAWQFALSFGVGSVLLIWVFGVVGASFTRFSRSRFLKALDADPGWTLLAMPFGNVLVYGFGAILFFPFFVFSVLGLIFAPEWNLAALLFGAATFGFFFFSCAYSFYKAVFVKRRWSDLEIEIRQPFQPVRKICFSEIASAGVWPVVGMIGFQASDGYRMRFWEQLYGAPALYKKLRETLGDRFRGRSDDLDVTLEQWEARQKIARDNSTSSDDAKLGI